DTTRRCGTIGGDPLPTPSTLRDLPSNVDYMGELFFGIPGWALGVLIAPSGPMTVLDADGSRK
ncbi:hypothetical protein LCGC14_1814580, partial [marine sediment metagenome]